MSKPDKDTTDTEFSVVRTLEDGVNLDSFWRIGHFGVNNPSGLAAGTYFLTCLVANVNGARRALQVLDNTETGEQTYRARSADGWTAWAPRSAGDGTTNLGATASPTGITITSDTGNDASVPLADGTNAGLMTPANFTKLAGVEANATADQTAAEIVAAVSSNLGSGAWKGETQYIANNTVVNLKNWTNKLSRMGRFSERPRINLYGDSITLGSGGIFQKNSPGQKLAEQLTLKGFPAKANLFGLVSSAASHNTFEPRMVFTGTWGAWDAIAGAGGTAMRCTSNAGTLTYTPGYTFDTVEIWYVKNSVGNGGGGNMTITIDGGATQFSTPTSGGLVSSQTISQTNAGFLLTSVVVTISGALAAHSITITNGATNNIQIAGFEPYTTTSPEILIRCCGASSFQVANFIASTRPNSIWQLTTDLHIICFGANEAVSAVAPATYTTNLNTLEGHCRVQSSTDILYWTFPQLASSQASFAAQQAIVDAMIAQAPTDITVIDIHRRGKDRGGYTALGDPSYGWYADTLHPAAFHNRDIAKTLADVLVWER